MRFRRCWPVFGWSLIIIILSGIPGSYFPEVLTFREWLGPDKLAHLAMFGGFSFLFLYAFSDKYSKKKNLNRYIFLSLVVGMVFGFLTELMQRFLFVGRNGNIFDFGADAIGLLLGIVAFRIFYRRKIEAVKNN
jgi:VanZ family protein